MEKSYEEQMKSLTEDQKVELLNKLLKTLGFTRIRHEQKRRKHVLRFEGKSEL